MIPIPSTVLLRFIGSKKQMNCICFSQMPKETFGICEEGSGLFYVRILLDG